MSFPQRPPPSSPKRHEPSPYRDSPRRKRHNDVETGGYDEPPRTPYSPTKKGRQEPYVHNMPSPGTPTGHREDRDPMMDVPGSGGDFSRKRSLIRPERNRIDRDHPNFHYRQHAHNMTVYPSTTGNDPIVEDHIEVETASSGSTDGKTLNNVEPAPSHGPRYTDESPPRGRNRGHVAPRVPVQMDRAERGSKRLQRKLTRKETSKLEADEKQREKERDAARPPSFWNVYCAVITFWCPGAILACFGKPAKAQQRAWREKMGLLSIILLICAFVGFLTFGFTEAVCAAAPIRYNVNTIQKGFMIFHGKAYDLSKSQHPAAQGILPNTNLMYDLAPDQPYAGKDGSFLFQNVNGACKGLITRADDSDVPTNADGDLAWYFPCNVFSPDGSTQPNKTIPYYLGYACHTTSNGRKAFYKGLKTEGDVYYTWDMIRNPSRNLMVYSGDVLDLDLLRWFNTSQVKYPAQFDDLRQNSAVKGVDVTHSFQSSAEKRIASCLSEIIKVGSIDSESVGCIASKVVLYVSLVFILSIVIVKFLLALTFQWFFSRRFAASKASLGPKSKKRNQQIEEWSDDIYRPPPKLNNASGGGMSEKSSKRSSAFLPTTSRFTSPYAVDRTFAKHRANPTTMASQSSTSRLMAPAPMFKQTDGSQGSFPLTDPINSQTVGDSRASLMLSQGQDQRYSSVMSDVEGPGPSGFIHEAVVPQPPPEWQPFGYPLAHTICLVTAYSEGADGLRTTLDSIATTDYPNSHKTIFVVCDGMIKGKGESLSTPEVALSMMGDHAVLPDEVQAFSYVAVASGSKRHNMAKVYSGFYNYGEQSVIPLEKQQRVPMMVVVKCGTPDEASKSKPGNRGKRDSQIILMSFLQKVMFDERMTELEFEMFNGLWKITGISPDFYEIVLMVDADTKVFPDSLTHMVSAMVKDPEIMGLCGETKIANKKDSWVSMIQVFEYFISHHLSKSFESVFGGVTCLPGCFCMYRIKAPKGGQNYWVPILANPDVVEHYSENVVDTLHKKNLLLLGEDRYLSTLMLKTFPKRKQVFVPQGVCKTTVPDKFSVLLSQRRRWINSTVHNLMELVLVRDLCGTFCFSMQFVVFIELVGTLVLPAAISFTFYLIVISIVKKPTPVIPLVLLALILGLPAVLIVLTAHRWSYVLWMLIYLVSLPIWNFVLPAYAYWKFDDFSWGDTRKTAGEKTKKAGIEYEGEFDSTKITMKRWGDFERERRLKAPSSGWSQPPTSSGGWTQQHKGYEDYSEL
ncbi:MAG: Chitin synthase, class 3 [Candelina submexicana]|nr:MAG: Chitin synthase, class 3 [Candelina submexicana]